MNSSYKSNLTSVTGNGFKTIFDPIFGDHIRSRVRDYSKTRHYSEKLETEYTEYKFKQMKNTNSKANTAEAAKYSVGQPVYVKKYNRRIGEFQIYEGEIISSVDKGFGAISYTLLALNTGKICKAWEEDIYTSYSAAMNEICNEKSNNNAKELKKEDIQPKVTYDNSQYVNSTYNSVSVVPDYPETGTVILKGSNGIERDACHIVDDIDTAKCDITEINSRCSDIEQHVNYLETELIKEKKKRGKLAKLGIACLFGG